MNTSAQSEIDQSSWIAKGFEIYIFYLFYTFWNLKFYQVIIFFFFLSHNRLKFWKRISTDILNLKKNNKKLADAFPIINLSECLTKWPIKNNQNR